MVGTLPGHPALLGLTLRSICRKLHTMVTVKLAVDLEEVQGKGWIAHSNDVRATAQGETRDEALANLKELLERYPEVIDELLAATKSHRPELELIPA
jgi:predicted RNase H-like HicB family nuclease